MKATRTYGLACGLFLLAGIVACDDISPFISEEALARRLDLDGDGVKNAEDCAPENPNVTNFTFWRDLDGDDFGAGEPIKGCPDNGDFTDPSKEGFATKAGDCNDGNNTVYPGAQEVCDLADNNCNDVVDEGFVSHWCRDADQDGRGDPNDTRSDCGAPNGYVAVAECSDCDDTPGSGASVHPGAEELCDDGIDNDCDGVVDNAEAATLWCRDADNDGAGDPTDAFYSCEDQEGYGADCGDCNDDDPNVGPGVAEAYGDGVDNDCDGVTDTDAVNVAWYRDADGDGFGDPTVAQSAAAPPPGFVGNALDCDDTSDAVKPGVAEVCNNGIDDNCDGTPNECVLSGHHTTAEANITINGVGAESMTGIDLNNDGVDDLAASGGGAVRVFFGPMQDGTVEAAAAQVTINGVDGTAMTAIDLNNDGMDDLAASGGNAVRVFFGPMQAGTLEAAAAQVTINGVDGTAMTAIDLNNDGMDDLAASGGNAVRVFFGPMQAGTLDAAAAQVTINGQNADDQFGSSIATLPDFNGDGINDLAVGAKNAGSALADGGRAYLITGPIANGNVRTVTNQNSWQGSYFAEKFGSNVTSFDFNGDNLTDILVAGRQAKKSGKAVGCIYMIHGTQTPVGSRSSSLEPSWCGENDRDLVGVLPSRIPDLNDDGIHDIVVGASGTQTINVFYSVGL